MLDYLLQLYPIFKHAINDRFIHTLSLIHSLDLWLDHLSCKTRNFEIVSANRVTFGNIHKSSPESFNNSSSSVNAWREVGFSQLKGVECAKKDELA
jgi:hypothetical protein